VGVHTVDKTGVFFMNTYFATFITGTSQLVESQLTKLGNISVAKIYDGLIVFRSSRSWKELQNIRYLNNLFLLLAIKENRRSGKGALDELMNTIARQGVRTSAAFQEIVRGKRSFRVFASVENETVSMSRRLLQGVERRIQKGSGLRLNIQKPNLEFWFISRREGVVLFGLRFTRVRAETKQRRKGELRAELAHVLCLLSEPKSFDVVCDPFVGYGAIAIERARSFPYQRIYASDIDEMLVRELRRKTGGIKNMKVAQANALRLDLPDASIDKIITDPPWGEYQGMPSLERFYEEMLSEFRRVLKADGIVVILIGPKETFEYVLQNKFGQIFAMNSKYDILVSGKKAAIYKITRKKR